MRARPMGPGLGRAAACRGHVFERTCYVPAGYYRWEELPAAARRDTENLREEYEYVHGRGPEVLTYQFLVVPHAQLVGVLEREFGEDFDRRVSSPEVKRLARAISKEGLKSPPVDGEGWKRALALASLGLDMPFFMVVPPFGRQDPVFIPTLEGGRFVMG